ncbi:hypothetical protein L0156_23730 [bacterium]|nr:hypothetical protein [bacterium]
MKIIPLFIGLFCLLGFAGAQEVRQEFMSLYYKGEYEKAHALLDSAISDEVARQIWDSRIHLQAEIPGCLRPSNASIQAFAHLCIGEFENAQKQFADDWISLWAKATYSYWNADIASARKQIEQALTLQPQNPDLLFFAGDLADSSEKTIEYFERFLKLQSEDQVKRNIAEFSIGFLKKTAGMQLNIIKVDQGVQEIETDYEPSGVNISAVVNSEEKMKLVVDTGAGSGLVLEKRKWTPQVVNEVVMLGLGKKQISTSKRVVLDLFHAGKFTIQNPLATENETMPFPDIDGLIGSAAFSSHRLLLPLKSGKNLVLLPYEMDPLEYFEDKKLKFKKQLTFPFFVVNKLIILKGRIKKSSGDLDILVDTGADSSFISAAAAKRFVTINYPLSMQLRNQAKITGVGGKANNLLIAENVEVGIGELSKNFNNMFAVNFAETSEALGLEIDLLLGRDFLEGYTLLIDYRNRQITFLK